MRGDRKSTSRDRREDSESSEEGQIVNKERFSEEKGEDERLRRGGSEDEGHGWGGRDSCRGNDKDERQGKKESHRLHHGDRWRGGEKDRRRFKDHRRRYDSKEEDHRELARKEERDRDRDRRRKVERGGDTERDRRACHDSDEEDDKEFARKSERDRDRDRRHIVEKDGDNESNHREKDVSRRQEENGKKEDRNGRMVEDANSQQRATIPRGNLNGDASNLGKSGSVYIPPFKMAMMMKEVQDKSSVEYQRLTWDALIKSINELVNKVNATKGVYVLRSRGKFGDFTQFGSRVHLDDFDALGSHSLLYDFALFRSRATIFDFNKRFPIL